MADSLDVQKTSVGREAELLQGREIVQPSSDSEVVGVVDDRLRSQSTALFMILLDLGALEIDQERGRHPLRDDAGTEPGLGRSQDAAIEDQLHLLGTTEIEILADDLLEKDASCERSVEDLGEGELRLEDGDVVSESGLAVLRREGMREARKPLADVVRRSPRERRPFRATEKSADRRFFLVCD